MKIKFISLIMASMVLAINLPAHAESTSDIPQITILELMESVITPTTNILWGVEDPKTDEDWKPLEDAAIAVIASGTLMNLGGTGPNDNEWVKDPAWRAFSQIVTNAGIDALKAIRARDLEALFEAGNVLYPPCEACHLQFNPGVINQE